MSDIYESTSLPSSLDDIKRDATILDVADAQIAVSEKLAMLKEPSGAPEPEITPLMPELAMPELVVPEPVMATPEESVTPEPVMAMSEANAVQSILQSALQRIEAISAELGAKVYSLEQRVIENDDDDDDYQFDTRLLNEVEETAGAFAKPFDIARISAEGFSIENNRSTIDAHWIAGAKVTGIIAGTVPVYNATNDEWDISSVTAEGFVYILIDRSAATFTIEFESTLPNGDETEEIFPLYYIPFADESITRGSIIDLRAGIHAMAFS